MKSDALVVNIDPTSLYAYWDLWDPAKTVEHVCTALAGHYGLVHLKEIGLHEGFHIQSGLTPIGTGPTDWGQVLRLVAPHVPEDSWVILEHVLSADEGRASLALLREAAKVAGRGPGVVALDNPFVGAPGEVPVFGVRCEELATECLSRIAACRVPTPSIHDTVATFQKRTTARHFSRAVATLQLPPLEYGAADCFPRDAPPASAEAPPPHHHGSR